MKNYNLEIYTRSICSDCQDLKKFLKEQRVSFKSYELDNDFEKEQEMIGITGNHIVPALVFTRSGLFKKKKVFIGFETNRNEIEALLKINNN